KIVDSHVLLDLLFTFIAYIQVPPFLYDMTASCKFERSHFQRSFLKRDPGGHSMISIQRPIELVGMPGSNSPTGFFKQGLIVINPYPFDTHQLSCNTSQPSAEHQFLYFVVLLPEIEDL